MRRILTEAEITEIKRLTLAREKAARPDHRFVVTVKKMTNDNGLPFVEVTSWRH